MFWDIFITSASLIAGIILVGYGINKALTKNKE